MNPEREKIILGIKQNNLNKSTVEKNIKIWQKKLLELKQERVILDEKLFKMDNKPLF